jgi:hypothetical protein
MLLASHGQVFMTDEPPQPAFQGEIMLAGWSDSHTQGVRVTFWLQDDAALEPFRMATVRKGKTAGQRYMAVLVEIGDDEKPVRHPSSDAHLLLTGPDFLNYARAMAPKAGARDHWDSTRARAWAKYVIQVESLAEIDTDPSARLRFERLIRVPFAEWNGTRERESDGQVDIPDA